MSKQGRSTSLFVGADCLIVALLATILLAIREPTVTDNTLAGCFFITWVIAAVLGVISSAYHWITGIAKEAWDEVKDEDDE